MNTIIGFISKFLPSRLQTEIYKNPYAELFDPEDEAISNYVNQILYKVCLEWQQKAEQDVDEFLANLESEVERYQKLHCTDHSTELIEDPSPQIGDHIQQIGDYIQQIEDPTQQIGDYIQQIEDPSPQIGDHIQLIGDHIQQIGDYIKQIEDPTLQIGGPTQQAGDHIQQIGDHNQQVAKTTEKKHSKACEVNETAVQNYVEFIIRKAQLEVEEDMDNQAKLDATILVKKRSMNTDIVPESIKQLKDQIVEKLKNHASSETQGTSDDEGAGTGHSLPPFQTCNVKSPAQNKPKSNIQVIEEVLEFVGEALNKLNKQISVADLNAPQKSESNETLKLEEPNQETDSSKDGFSHHLTTVRDEVNKIEKIEGNLIAAQSDSKKRDNHDKKKRRMTLQVEDTAKSLCVSTRRIGTKHPSLESTSVTLKMMLGVDNSRGQSDTVLPPNSHGDLVDAEDETKANIKATTGVEEKGDKLNSLPNSAGHTDIHLQKSMEKWLAKRKNVKPPEVPKYVFRKPKPKANGLFRLPIWERSMTPKVAEDEPSSGECHSAIASKSHRNDSSISKFKRISPSSVVFSDNAPAFKIVTGRKAKGDGAEITEDSEMENKDDDKKQTDAAIYDYENRHQTVDCPKQATDSENAELPKTRYSFVRVNYEMVPEIDLTSSSSDLQQEEIKDELVANIAGSIDNPDCEQTDVVNKPEIESEENKEILVIGIPEEGEAVFSVQSSKADLTASAATSTTDQSHQKNLDKVNAILQRARTRKSRATHPLKNKDLSELTEMETETVEIVDANVVESQTQKFPKINPETSKKPTEPSSNRTGTRRSQSLKETGQKSHKPMISNLKPPSVSPVAKKLVEPKTKSKRESLKTMNTKPVKEEPVQVPRENVSKHPRINRKPESTIETVSTAPSYSHKRSKIPVPTKDLKIDKKTAHVLPNSPKRTVLPIMNNEIKSVCTIKAAGPCQTGSTLVRGMSKHTARMARKAVPVVQNTAEERFQQCLKKERKKKSATKKTDAGKLVCDTSVSKRLDQETISDKEITAFPDKEITAIPDKEITAIPDEEIHTAEPKIVVSTENLDVIEEEEDSCETESFVIKDEVNVADEEWEIITNDELDYEITDDDKIDWEVIDIEDCVSAEREQACSIEYKTPDKESEPSRTSSSNIHILQWLHETEKEQRLHLRETVGRDCRRINPQVRQHHQGGSLSIIDERSTRTRMMQYRSNNNRSVYSATSASQFNGILSSGNLSANHAICCEGMDFTNVFGKGNLLQLYLEFQREYSRLFRLEIQKNPLLQMLIQCQQQQSERISKHGHPLPGLLTIHECEATDNGVLDPSIGTEVYRGDNGHDKSNENEKGHFQTKCIPYSCKYISRDTENMGLDQYLRPSHIFLENDCVRIDGMDNGGLLQDSKYTSKPGFIVSDEYSVCRSEKGVLCGNESVDDNLGISNYLRPRHIFSDDIDTSFHEIAIKGFEECETTQIETEQAESDVVGVTVPEIHYVAAEHMPVGKGVYGKIQNNKKSLLRNLKRFLNCRKGTKENNYRQETSKEEKDGLVQRNKNCNANGSDKPVADELGNSGFDMVFEMVMAGKRSCHVVRIMQYQTMLWLLRQQRHG